MAPRNVSQKLNIIIKLQHFLQELHFVRDRLLEFLHVCLSYVCLSQLAIDSWD